MLKLNHMTQLLPDNGTTTRQVRTLIADDEPRARQALGALLGLATWVAPDHTQVTVRVVGEAANGQ
jgi:DNA-binding NarL/FixJ family response regulator